MDELVVQVRRLIDQAVERCRGSVVESQLLAVRQRLDEPLRVAIAGRVKAGKSTLLNALVGEQLAPTDAGECTKIVTWYQHGPTYRATLELVDGSTRQAPFSRESGAIDIDLGDAAVADVERIVVEWPSQRLVDLTLIDTPGVASINTELSQRALRFLAPDDESPMEADAVVYLMRHMHADDLSFLESFHDDELANASPVNAIGLLSRADEVGVGRPNAMRVAERIATRYRSDPKLRKLCQTVRPIGGLLAETATTLTQDEFQAMEELAALDRKVIEAMMLSADRFAAESSDCDLPPLVRRHLLDRFGLYGVRVALPMIRQGRADSAGALAEALEAKSGIIGLREDLLERFASRRDVLQARSALLAVRRLLAIAPPDVARDLLPEVERIRSGAHAFAELQVLNDYRRGWLEFDESDGPELERLLGGDGSEPTARLGLPPEADRAEVRAELLRVIDKWRRKGEHPLSSREVSNAATVLVRTCEGTLAGFDEREKEHRGGGTSTEAN